jgi:hypothetical protein
MKIRSIIYGLILFLTVLYLTGTSQARVINDAECGFQVTIPNNWQTNSFMDGMDKVWAFAAPDNNAAIRIRTLKVQPGLSIDTLISVFETHILGGGQRLIIEPYTLNGINGKMAGYKGQFNNIDVGVGCFYTIQKRNAYIVWSMIPISLFNARSAETDAIMNTFTLSRTGANHYPADDKDLPRKPHGYKPIGPALGDRNFQYQILTVDDSGFEFLYPKHFKRFQQSEGQTQWADPDAATGSRVVMVVQTLMRSAGNTMEAVHNRLISQVKSNSAAKLLGSKQLRINDIPSYELRFTLNQQDHLKYFYYLVLDLQGPNVATVSFVGPESMQEEIEQHFAKLKESVKQTQKPGTGIGVPEPTGKCRSLGQVYTDGTGDSRTKKRGGSYLAIAKKDIPLTSSININVLSGTLSYVTIHARYDGGTWSTAYQGPLTKLSVNQFKSFLSQPNCSHLIVSVNGAHEVYTSIPCKAKVNICQ